MDVISEHVFNSKMFTVPVYMHKGILAMEIELYDLLFLMCIYMISIRLKINFQKI